MTAADIHALLTTQLPEYDRALVGWPAILGYLASFHIRRRNGLPLTRRIIGLWHRHHSFPLTHGCWRPRHVTPTLTSTFAVTAWLLSQPHSDGLFRLYPPPDNAHPKAGLGRDLSSAELEPAARAA